MKIFTAEFWKQIDWRFALESAWEFAKANPLEVVIWAVGIIVGWYLFWAVFRYIYWRFNEKNLVYMQITLPRDDSPKDKEKDVEKDFRERIGIMEQLYRSLYEIRELSIENMIRRILFQDQIVSFEIVAQEKIVRFIVVVPQRYQSIVEKQITSYYHEADVQLIKPYVIKKRIQMRNNWNSA